MDELGTVEKGLVSLDKGGLDHTFRFRKAMASWGFGVSPSRDTEEQKVKIQEIWVKRKKIKKLD